MTRTQWTQRSLILSGCIAIALLGLHTRDGSSAETNRLCDAAKARPFPPGAPKASDVIMRSLRIRPSSNRDPHDTMRALEDFHVTTLAWAYIEDPEFIAKVKRSGRRFGGAAAAPSYVGTKGRDDWLKSVCIVNRDGEVIIAPWKRNWASRTLWGCVNNPELERGYMEYLQRYIDAGVDIMQRDEPTANQAATHWGGCFCHHCMKGFRQYLRVNCPAERLKQLGAESLDSFDYRTHLQKIDAPVGDAFNTWDGGDLKEHFVAFQTEATIAFHQRTRAAINDYAGRRVPFSCNNGARRLSEIEMLFDWAFGELAYRHATAAHIHHAMQEATKHQHRQIITMPKKGDRLFMDQWQQLTRQTIAMAYACGGHCMVPWDVYMPREAPRYFGQPQQYADLFGFIRANRCFLDGYEQAEASGHGVPREQQPRSAAVRILGGDQVAVQVRALPGERNAPVVVHLVDWSDDPTSFKLMVDPGRFFGDQPLRIRLLRPVPYGRTQHEAAEETGKFESLSQTVVLAEGRHTSVDIPPLSPWGMVLIEPSKMDDAAVWQPLVWAEQDSLYAERLMIHMTCPTVGARIHYTLDGSEPDANFLVYDGPLEITQTTQVRAVAIAAEARSPSVSVRFSRVENAEGALAPDAPPLSEALKLWLSAPTPGSVIRDGDTLDRWQAKAGPHAVTPTAKLTDGRTPEPPIFQSEGINGRPAVTFDGVDDQLVVSDFANQYLAGSAFTLFMVTRSKSAEFGVCGNGESGSGGIPRLYLTRQHFCYDTLRGLTPQVPDNEAAISVFAHDGKETIAAWVNGERQGRMSGRPVVPEFGGGNLAIPFRAGNRGQSGGIGEVIIYNRLLADGERRAVEAWLAGRYRIGVRRWR